MAKKISTQSKDMYLIIGANGFLGSYLLDLLPQYTSEKIIACSRHIPSVKKENIEWITCDITKEKDVQSLYEKSRHTSLKVFFLAAYQHPDKVLEYPYVAWQTNITSLARFLGIFENIDKFYYASTEVVYGQTEGRYFCETDALNPVSRYGQQKVLAEQITLAAGYNVVRLPVLMGPSLLPDRPHFYDQIVATVRDGKKMKMFSDQIRNFIDFGTAAQALISLMRSTEAQQYPIVNIAGDEALSKYDIAVRIVKKHGLDPSNIIPIQMDNANDIFTEKRAKVTLLDNSLLKSILHLNQFSARI